MFDSRTWRGAALCLLVMSAARSADAQHVATSFEQLAVLVNRGDVVTVSDAAGRQIRGTIADLSPSLLTLFVDGNQRTLDQRDVEAIRRRRHGSLETGATWGFGCGLAFGAFAGYIVATDGAGAGWAVAEAALWSALGTGIGVGISAATAHQDLIYTKRAPSAAFSVSPLVTGGRAGVLMSLRF